MLVLLTSWRAKEKARTNFMSPRASVRTVFDVVMEVTIKYANFLCKRRRTHARYQFHWTARFASPFKGNLFRKITRVRTCGCLVGLRTGMCVLRAKTFSTISGLLADSGLERFPGYRRKFKFMSNHKINCYSITLSSRSCFLGPDGRRTVGVPSLWPVMAMPMKTGSEDQIACLLLRAL